ncbi:hypothetical protein ACWDZ6_17690 [Streptomyces sp. NPDC002926]
MSRGTRKEVLLPLEEPSLGAVRARLVQKRLGEGRASKGTLPRLVSTGKTGSGKSTLGNLLVGADDLLRTTGHQDCTDAAHLLTFPHGLTYVDLPGVAGDDRLENFNRVALGMPQTPTWPTVEEVRVLRYERLRCTGEQRHPAEGFPTDLLQPDLVLYLIAPHRGFGRAEAPYLKDLLCAVGRERLLFVLNLFHGAGGRRMATAENLEDVHGQLARWHREVGLKLDTSRVVPMDCRSGAGLAELLSAARDYLGGSTALTDVITYQSERALGVYREEVQRAVVGFAAQVALSAPADDESASELPTMAGRLLLEYAGRLAENGGAVHDAWLEPFAALIGKEVAKLRKVATEPIIERRSKDIYEKVPRYGWVKETDYDRPIYETRRRKVKVPPGDFDEFLDGVGSWFNGDGFVAERWVNEEVLVGYKKKKRQVVEGYDKRHVRTDHWDETVGHREVAVTYDPLGPRGIALVLTAWHAALATLGGGQPGKLNGIRRDIHHRIKRLDTAPDQLAAHAASILPEATVRLLDEVLRAGETGGSP